MSKKDIQFNLRIPEELKAKIDAAAKANQRSINAEATSRLYDSFVMNDNIQVEAAKSLKTFFELDLRQSEKSGSRTFKFCTK